MVAVGMLVFMASTAAAWSKNTHVHIGEAVAEEGVENPPDGMTEEEVVQHMAELAQWADEPSESEIFYEDVYDVEDPAENVDVTEGDFGYDAEYNPWYNQLVATIDEEVVEIPGGSALNFDHWISVSNYDSWWAPFEGASHLNSAEFVENSKDLMDENPERGVQVLARGQHYIQDTGVTYHVVAWDNFGGIFDRIDEDSDEGLHHFEYEGYVGDQHEAADYTIGDDGAKDRYREAMEEGAAASYEVELDGASDVEEFTVDNARTTLDHAGEIMPTRDLLFGSDWTEEDGKEATEDVLYETSKSTAALYDYAAPGVFDFNGEVIEDYEEDEGLWDWFTSLLWGWW